MRLNIVRIHMLCIATAMTIIGILQPSDTTNRLCKIAKRVFEKPHVTTDSTKRLRDEMTK